MLRSRRPSRSRIRTRHWSLSSQAARASSAPASAGLRAAAPSRGRAPGSLQGADRSPPVHKRPAATPYRKRICGADRWTLVSLSAGPPLGGYPPRKRRPPHTCPGSGRTLHRPSSGSAWLLAACHPTGVEQISDSALVGDHPRRHLRFREPHDLRAPGQGVLHHRPGSRRADLPSGCPATIEQPS